MIRYTLAALVFCSTLAQAQGGDMQKNMREKMRKRMEEISRLMRESERLLLDITKVDRLVARQQAIVRELEKLEPPKQNDPASAARAKKAEDLRQQQAEAARRLSELFDGQRQRGERTVAELMDLLRNWPTQHGNRPSSGGPDHKSKAQKEREKRLREQQEQKQRNKADRPRNKKDKFKQQRGRRTEDKQQANRALHAYEAWIVTLPPKQQERISRGDLSDIPSAYRRLVREYTALRAKREAEREEDK